MKKENSGKGWPYAIGAAITFVFFAGVATVVITANANIQMSDNYMTKYQNADAKANHFIKERLRFNNAYIITYNAKDFTNNNSFISYKVSDKEGHLINNAKLTLAMSRPETDIYNKSFNMPKIKNGIYTFSLGKLERKGIWNFILKVEVADKQRFFNLKADTRKKEVKEYN
jgi:nitrogen fixation protein FixH